LGGDVVGVPDLPRRSVVISDGGWSIDGTLNFASGSIRMQSSALECQGALIHSEAMLGLRGSRFDAGHHLTLGPLTSGRLDLGGSSLHGQTITLIPGTSKLELVGVTLRADELDVLLDGEDAGVDMRDMNAACQRVHVQGDGRSSLIVGPRTELEASGPVRVSAGDYKVPGLMLSTARVAAERLEVFQGVAIIGAGAVVDIKERAVVDEGVLCLAGGVIRTPQLDLLGKVDNRSGQPDWPDRPNFLTLPPVAQPGLSESADLQKMAEGFAYRLGMLALQQVKQPPPSLQLVQEAASALAQARTVEQQRQTAMHYARVLGSLTRALDPLPDASAAVEGSAPEIDPAKLASIVAVISKANADIQSARSLADIERIMARTSGLIESSEGKPTPAVTSSNTTAQGVVDTLLRTPFQARRKSSLLTGTGTIEGNVSNSAIVLIPDAEQSLEVTGDYIQQSEGVLRLTLGPHRLAHQALPAFDLPTNQGRNAGLRVDGYVFFESTVGSMGFEFDTCDDALLEPGSTYSLINGRGGISPPPRYAYSTRNPNTFLGLHRGVSTPWQGVTFSVLGTRDVLSALVLRTPTVLEIGADGRPNGVPLTLWQNGKLPRKLVLVTHGTNSRIEIEEFSSESLMRTAYQMARFGHEKHLEDWRVAVLDWREYSTGSMQLNDPNGAPVFQPWVSAFIGADIGRACADLLLDCGLDYTELSEIHILGHSSGTWLIDAFTKRIRERALEFGTHGPPQIQVTAFDAFTWPADAQGPLSDAADRTEQYLDGRLPGTRSSHPTGVNVDVVWLDPDITFTIDDAKRLMLSLSGLAPRHSSMGYPFWNNRSGLPRRVGFGGYVDHTIPRDSSASQILRYAKLSWPDQLFDFSLPAVVTNVDHLFGHGWPYEWYARTIEACRGVEFKPGSIWCPSLCWDQWGFVTSPMYADYLRKLGKPVPTRSVSKKIRVLPREGDCTQ